MNPPDTPGNPLPRARRRHLTRFPDRVSTGGVVGSSRSSSCSVTAPYPSLSTSPMSNHPERKTARFFVAVGSQGQGPTLYRLSVVPGREEEDCEVAEAMPDGSYHYWPELVRGGIRHAEAAVLQKTRPRI